MTVDKLRRCILLDDDALHNIVTEKRLKRLGIELLSFTSSKELLQRSDLEDFGCILIDYNLGMDNGIEVMKQIHKRNRYIPCIIVTAWGSDELVVEAMQEGAYSYLLKDSKKGYIEAIPRLIRAAQEDMKTQVQREAKLVEAKQEAEEANQAKSDFLGVISHELRTPLQAILGFSECLVEGIYGELTEKQKGILKRVSLAAQHLGCLIDDLMTITKLQKGRLELNKSHFNLIDLLHFCKGLAEEQTNPWELQVELDIKLSSYPLFADEVRVRQIILNLLSNALKFSKKGKVTLGLEEKSDSLALYVKDEGVGIAEDKKEQIFLPFMQADNSIQRDFGGTGLGLSIVREIVKMHGWEVGLDSSLDKGSTFFVCIPKQAHEKA